MPQFAILMYEDDNAWAKLPEDERAATMEKYMAFVKDLRETGCFVEGSPIGREGVVLTPGQAGVVESEFTQAKHVLTGYFIIEADAIASAVEIAKQCPALTHGECVIVRPASH